LNKGPTCFFLFLQQAGDLFFFLLDNDLDETDEDSLFSLFTSLIIFFLLRAANSTPPFNIGYPMNKRLYASGHLLSLFRNFKKIISVPSILNRIFN